MYLNSYCSYTAIVQPFIQKNTQKKMLHKPTQRKIPKKYENNQKIQAEQIKKASSKPVMRSASNAPIPKTAERQPSVRGRVNKVEEKVDRVVKGLNNVQLQTLLIQEIKGIKNQLKEIKQHIGINGNGNGNGSERKQGGQGHQYQQQYQHEQQQQEQQQNIYNVQQNQPQSPQPQKHRQQQIPNQPITQTRGSRIAIQNDSRSYPQKQPPRNPNPPQNNGYKLYEKQKQLMDVGKIQPYMKQFKIEVSKNMMPFYYGYHKKSSKPVIIKYCPQNRSMEPIFNLYERLWKNIVKAKSICINKVYDLNEPLATYILVLQANKYSLLQILQNRILTVSQILISILKALQFFHECGFLYRNLHPSHIMYSHENQIVLIDLKNMKRFVDIKGKHVAVVKEEGEPEDEFVSNSRARRLKEGRKDDLEALGYLGLFVMQGWLPWTIGNLVQVRSKLTLKELCGKFPGLLEFMINVSQMGTEDVPDYEKLGQCLANI